MSTACNIFCNVIMCNLRDLSPGDRLFIGTSTGNLQLYQLHDDEECRGQPDLTTNKNLGRKPIEQIEFSKDLNTLVVLSGSCSPVTYSCAERANRRSRHVVSAARPRTTHTIAADT